MTAYQTLEQRFARLAALEGAAGILGWDAQTLMPDWVWLALLVVGLPLLVFWPTHRVLQRWRGRPGARRRL